MGPAVLAVSWGDVPTWLSSTTSLVALAFGVVAVVITRRTFQIESERDRLNAELRGRQDAFARRGQAALISAWWGSAPDGQGWGVYLRNASETPVYQSHATITNPNDPSETIRIRLAVIPPASEPVFHPVRLAAADRRVGLTFTDAAGVRWARDTYGRLTELEPRLTIWGAERAEAVLEKFADDFLAAYGVTLTYHTHEFHQRLDRYLTAGPHQIGDVLDTPHDWIGRLAAGDVIEPVVLPEDQHEMFLPEALRALTYRGRLFGLPLTIQCPVLIRNLDLAPTAPATFEALLVHGKALIDAGQVRRSLAVQANPFQLSPIFTAAGAPPLPAGASDDPAAAAEPLDLTALVRALTTLRDLGPHGQGVLDPDADEVTTRGQFLDRATPYLIGLSEDLADIRRSGLRYATSAVPGFADGPQPRPLLSVRGFCVATHGTNRAIARDLVADYLVRQDVAHRITRDLAAPTCLRQIPAPDDIAALRGGGNAVLMPNHPQVIQMWKPLYQAQYAALSGADPTHTAHQLAAALTDRQTP